MAGRCRKLERAALLSPPADQLRRIPRAVQQQIGPLLSKLPPPLHVHRAVVGAFNLVLAGQGEALGAHNARYGHERSALIYTHLSARHAPYNAVAIPPAGEAAYVVDGLFHHEADLSTLTHHTDGGGVSDHNFALTALLGIRFAPRIPNIADRKLYAFGPASTWPALAPFIAGKPDEKLIAAHWDDVLQFACSVRTGVVSASLMLKRLGACPRQNGLALALREVERIERTLRTLDWIELPSLRRQTTAELNKSESRHALARAVAFHRLGRLRDRTAAMLQHRASALALVTGAIALWNTVYLGRALDALRARGEAIPDSLLVHVAPSGWQHINPPATISGAPTAASARTGSGRCGTWQNHHRLRPRDVHAPSRKRESSIHLDFARFTDL